MTHFSNNFDKVRYVKSIKIGKQSNVKVFVNGYKHNTNTVRPINREEIHFDQLTWYRYSLMFIYKKCIRFNFSFCVEYARSREVNMKLCQRTHVRASTNRNKANMCIHLYKQYSYIASRGRRGRDRMVVGIIITYTISAYHHH